jgi:hypothetical protein
LFVILLPAKILVPWAREPQIEGLGAVAGRLFPQILQRLDKRSSDAFVHTRKELNMKQSIKIVVLAVGLVVMVQIVLSSWSRKVSAQEPVTSGNATSEFLLYCSSFSPQDTCTNLQVVAADGKFGFLRSLFSTSSGIEITDFEWTALNCTADPNETFRAVLTNQDGTALLMQSGARADDNGLAIGAIHATTGIRLTQLTDSMIVVPCGSQTATLRGYKIN